MYSKLLFCIFCEAITELYVSTRPTEGVREYADPHKSNRKGAMTMVLHSAIYL
jgi:hypothetical protein